VNGDVKAEIVDDEISSEHLDVCPESNIASFRERHWVMSAMMGVDIISLQLSLYLGYLCRRMVDLWWPAQISTSHYQSLIVGMLLVPAGYWLMRLYPGYGLTQVERLRRRVRTTFVFLMLFISWDFLVNHSGRSRGIFLFAFFFALIIPPIIQFIFQAMLIRMNCWGTPVVVLGAAHTGKHVVKSLLKDPTMGFRPVAVYDDDYNKVGKTLEGVPIIQGLLQANEVSGRIKYVLLAIPGAGKDLQVKLVHKLRFLHIIIIPDLIGMQSLWVEARDLSGMVGLQIQKNLLLRRSLYVKQFMDYFLGFPLFLLSIPILCFFAVWVMLASPGNPFYCQVREGRGGGKFKLWKLRTMYTEAENLLHKHLTANPEAKREWNQYFKLKDDPRILKGIGTILRKTSLDELPQLWNVLRGEMSLVGPRPFPHYHLEEFSDEFRKLRRSVIPGMTGLWQVSARSDGDLAVQEMLDTYYIRNWSIWLDISLLARTILIVFSGKGAY